MATFALVIGINEYRTISPDGSDDLWGAENDARAWVSWLTSQLGVPAPAVRLLATGTGTDVFAAPTYAAIQDGLTNLAEQMRAEKAAGRPATGLVTFSGHGVAMPDTGTAGAGLGNTMGLCPSDVNRDAAGEIVGAWRVGDLMAAFGDLVDDVTVVLDACYTTDPEGVRPHRSLSAPGATASVPPVPGRVILGCEPWAQSYEFLAGGQRRGAFSVAMLTLLEQWSLHHDRGTYPNVNHGDLVFRARELLTVLGVAQTPMLLGVARVALVPFLRSGMDIAMGTTSPEPDAHRHGSQLSSGPQTTSYRIYTLSAVWTSGAVPLANILSVGSAQPGTPAGYLPLTEYWNLLPYANGTGTLTGFSITLRTAPSNDWSGFPQDQTTYGVSNAPPNWPIAQNYQPGTWSPVNLLGSFDRASGEPVALQVDLNAAGTLLRSVCWRKGTKGHLNAGFLSGLPVLGTAHFDKPFTNQNAPMWAQS